MWCVWCTQDERFKKSVDGVNRKLVPNLWPFWRTTGVFQTDRQTELLQQYIAVFSFARGRAIETVHTLKRCDGRLNLLCSNRWSRCSWRHNDTFSERVWRHAVSRRQVPVWRHTWRVGRCWWIQKQYNIFYIFQDFFLGQLLRVDIIMPVSMYSHSVRPSVHKNFPIWTKFSLHVEFEEW